MRTALYLMIVVFGLASVSVADEIRTVSTEVPPLGLGASVEQCNLFYHNFCSGAAYQWNGYNGTMWVDLEGLQLPPAQIGVCFDLNDCGGGCAECQNLEGIWFAFARTTEYGRVNVEIYCANENCCPVGAPLAGYYDYSVDIGDAWQYLPFDDLTLDCVDCRFIALVTLKTPQHCAPYSDANDMNVGVGCENEWRCTGHSYCYRNLVDYCAEYGNPGRMLVGYDGVCPPNDGFFVEWLCYAYINCYGQVATEKSTWSEIKAFYR